LAIANLRRLSSPNNLSLVSDEPTDQMYLHVLRSKFSQARKCKEAAMYSFEPTEEQKMLIDAIHRFATNDLRPAGREADERSEIPRSLIEKGWGLGLLQASIPEEYGGFGDYSALTFNAWRRLEPWSADWTLVIPILLAGSEEQKKSFFRL
jgi:alkylation response protein AidB-like acyl-CoA dehydrogenase